MRSTFNVADCRFVRYLLQNCLFCKKKKKVWGKNPPKNLALAKRQIAGRVAGGSAVKQL